MREFTVRPNAPRHHEGALRRSATIGWPDGGDTELWFDVPPALADALVDSDDPWVLALVHAAMAWNVPLRINGAVSPSLLSNLVEYQSAVAAWSERPRWPGSQRYHQIEITADRSEERARPGDATVCAFSGGLDSTHSLGRHVRGEAGPASRPVGAALMVAGFDIPLDQPATFASALARARHITDDLEVPLHPIATNLRSLDLAWPDVFPGAVMASLSLFGGAYGAGMLASGRWWGWLDLPDDGSSPAWDWALGSRSFDAVHDGAGFDRPAKVASLGDWDVARRHVRFCWAGAELDRNCGRCRKCIGTYLLFRCYDLPPDCFDEVPADHELAELVSLPRPVWTIAHRYGESLLATAEAQGVDEPWTLALRRSLFRDRRRADLARLVSAGRLGRLAERLPIVRRRRRSHHAH